MTNEFHPGDHIRLLTGEKTNWIALEEPKVQVGDERVVESVDSHGGYLHYIGGKYGHPVGKWERIMEWVKTSEKYPREDANAEYSNDGIEVEGTMDYKCNRTCMMAGIAGGHGYFSSLGFATDGKQGEDINLICDDPEYWRYWDHDDIKWFYEGK